MLVNSHFLLAVLAASLPASTASPSSKGHSSAIAVSAPATAAHGASEVVDHSYASFSFPAHFFADFTGNKSYPNLFSRDIIELLGRKTAVVPYIRVGGTSADHTYFNTSQAISVVKGDVSTNGIPLAVTVGPVWFEGFGSFPGVKWVFQVNKNNGTDNAVREARAVLNSTGKGLIAFEIGNEPDLDPSYTEEAYVEKWLAIADAISSHVLRGNPYGLDDTFFFEALTFAAHNYRNFSVQGAFGEGIARNGNVKLVSQHQYANGNSPWVRLQNSFMNHTAIAANLSQYQEDRQFLQASFPNVTYVLGETNSDYINLNMAQIEGVFGSALWFVDYLLYGMTQNITRMHLIQGTTFGYSAWVPVATGGGGHAPYTPPYTRAPLYGFLFNADVIGTAPLIRVQEVPLGLWNFSAYAIYDDGALAKYALVNLDEWNSTTPYPRPQQAVTLTAPARSVHQKGAVTARVQRLVAPGASADSHITWGGLSWNYTDGRLAQSGRPSAETLAFDAHGQAQLTIASSEAVLVTFECAV